MMLRFTTSRGRRASSTKPAEWTWLARVPAMILAYGGAIIAVLAFERLVHSLISAFYAAVVVLPGGIAAGVCAFALSFTPRQRLFVLAATVIVALLPLGVVAVAVDFQEFRALFEQRALLLAAVMSGAMIVATGVLILGGVFPAEEGRQR